MEKNKEQYSYKKLYKKWQSKLRKKLERDAFNEKYECFICGRKEKLEIHHLLYTEDKEDFFNPKYWRMLCKNCHAQTPKKEKDDIKPSVKKIKKEIKIMLKVVKPKPPPIIYKINCEKCGIEFESENNENRRFCWDCFGFLMGRWDEYYEEYPERYPAYKRLERKERSEMGIT